MTRRLCSALMLALLTGAGSAVAQSYDIATDGMHSLSFGQATVQAQVQEPAAQPQSSYDAKRQAIWDKYKAIATGQAPEQEQAGGHPLTATATQKAEPYSAKSVIENYQNAQQQRQDMHTLRFKAPELSATTNAP